MTEAAIRVDRVSKSYQIYERPQDRLKQSLVPRLRRFFTENPGNYYREFRALRDVSFEVRKGETLGIIGQNGSGKSTLLQIICGTLNPSSGTVETSGRVAALLELGSGFNPDFTGRENVYLYAAVLGLARSEVDARFDAIAAFADIGDFINQPVKTYSSGMVVRLAFAVIAHVDADILVIDEALAVGDVVFTQKCMRFLRTFMETGTVLFVSHDIGSVLNLCSTAAWIDHGVLRMCGNAKDVTDAYLLECAQKVAGDSVTLAPLKGQARNESDPAGSQDSPERLDADTRISFFGNIAHSDGWTTSNAEIDSVKLTDMKGNVVPSFRGDEKVCLTITAAVKERIESPIIGFLLKDRLGQPLFGENTFDYTDGKSMVVEGGVLEAKFVFNMPMLPNGDYSMTVSLAEGNLQEHVHHHWLHDAALIQVISEKARYGLVGIPFESVTLSTIR